MKTPTLAVGIVTFNTAESLLKRCLQSIEVAAQHTDANVEIYIFDNGSTVPPLIEKTGISVRRSDQNIGFGRACNALLQTALGADCMLFLNPDARLSATSLESFVRALGDRRAFLSGWLKSGDSVQVDAYMLWFFSTSRLWRRKRYARILERKAERSSLVPVEKVSGGALFGRVQDFDFLGPFDPAFFLYGEDVDFSIRARRLGFELLALTSATVEHEASSSMKAHGELVERARTDAAIRLFATHRGYLVSLAGRLEMLLVSLVGLMRASQSSSRSRANRLARLTEFKRWGLRRNVSPFQAS